jgi:16S rRNA (guanine(527)-N(7))-methyltransferase RsmG
MREEFIKAIKTHQAAFDLDLQNNASARLADYYDLVMEYNPLLHLVAPCPAEEFAIRHILESLTLLEHLPTGTKFADVGTGAGLPSIPCLLVRDDLRAVLIESKEKKSKFLDLTVNKLGIGSRAEVVNKQFQEVDPADCESMTCRALDKFTDKLPRLLKWKKQRRLLLFGGPNLREALETQNVIFTEKLMPMSEQRFLFVLHR